MSMRVLNLVTSILHVYSQHTGRWIPPPAADSFAARMVPDLEGLELDHEDPAAYDESAWRVILRELLSCVPELFPPRLARDASMLPGACGIFFAGIKATGASYIPFWDDAYPAVLRQITDPPLGLAVAGDSSLLLRPSVAVVGSRFAAAWALDWATGFGRLAAAAGVGVVSGGAYGCDAAVHSGMLSGRFDNVPAIAVFAGGLDRPYPKHNIRLFEDIMASGGCLVSERASDARCRPHDFLARNRIISGLALATVIVQAAERSGAMVTARFAADQGRDVWVVRPPQTDIRATGNEILMGDGAPALGDPEEALGEFRDALGSCLF